MSTSVPKMEARANTGDSSLGGGGRQAPASPGAKDPFRLGFRWRRVTGPDGREDLEQIPLTPEDLVYPEEGDHVSQGLPHYTFLYPQADALRRHLEKRPGLVVTSDVILVLRHDGKNCAPDVAVIEGDFDPAEIKGGIPLAAVEGRLCFTLEAVSNLEKEIEEKDLKRNIKRYAKEGVAEYFTVYPVAERRVRDLVGRRLEKGVYAEIPVDAQGRVYSEKLGLFFQIDAASQELVVVDAETGQRLLISDEEEAGRKKAEAALAAAEAARRQAEAHGLRRGIEDLCAVLGLAWDDERRARVERLSASRLEALRRHLVNEKTWPEPFQDA
jgi:Putative restriction endonuclease